jgi:hypothetical protein
VAPKKTRASERGVAMARVLSVGLSKRRQSGDARDVGLIFEHARDEVKSMHKFACR